MIGLGRATNLFFMWCDTIWRRKNSETAETQENSVPETDITLLIAKKKHRVYQRRGLLGKSLPRPLM